MSGETEQQESGWTTDTLKYHVDQQLRDLKNLLDERHTSSEKAVQAALLSAEKAVTKAEMAAEKRFESTNEFRGQLNDMIATLMPRAEYDANHTNLVGRVNELNDRLTRSEGQDQGVQMTTGALVTVVTMAVLVLGLIITLATLFTR